MSSTHFENLLVDFKTELRKTGKETEALKEALKEMIERDKKKEMQMEKLCDENDKFRAILQDQQTRRRQLEAVNSRIAANNWPQVGHGVEENQEEASDKRPGQLQNQIDNPREEGTDTQHVKNNSCAQQFNQSNDIDQTTPNTSQVQKSTSSRGIAANQLVPNDATPGQRAIKDIEEFLPKKLRIRIDNPRREGADKQNSKKNHQRLPVLSEVRSQEFNQPIGTSNTSHVQKSTSSDNSKPENEKKRGITANNCPQIEHGVEENQEEAKERDEIDDILWFLPENMRNRIDNPRQEDNVRSRNQKWTRSNNSATDQFPNSIYSQFHLKRLHTLLGFEGLQQWNPINNSLTATRLNDEQITQCLYGFDGCRSCLWDPENPQKQTVKNPPRAHQMRLISMKDGNTWDNVSPDEKTLWSVIFGLTGDLQKQQVAEGKIEIQIEKQRREGSPPRKYGRRE